MARFDWIRCTGKALRGRDFMEMLPSLEKMPDDRGQVNRVLFGHAARGMAAIPGDPNALTCGNCAPVCGQNFREPAKRWTALGEGGLVVPGPR